MMEPHRLMFLGLGCIMGLSAGIVPGIGGLAGTAMLLPFTFTMDYSAFALLLGLGAATATGDLFPRSCSACPEVPRLGATVLDGYPMAKKGEAGRALSAAYMSLAHGRHLRRAAPRDQHSDPAAGDAVHRLAELLAFSILGISSRRSLRQRALRGSRPAASAS